MISLVLAGVLLTASPESPPWQPDVVCAAALSTEAESMQVSPAKDRQAWAKSARAMMQSPVFLEYRGRLDRVAKAAVAEGVPRSAIERDVELLKAPLGRARAAEPAAFARLLASCQAGS